MTVNPLFPAVTAAKFISVAGLMMMPIQIGALMDGLNLGETEAGFLGTLEFSALGAGLILTATNPLRTSARNYALLGLALILAGQVLSALAQDYETLCVLRFMVGFGGGLANAAATVTIAAHFEEPERTAGYAFGLVYVAGGLLYLVAPYVTAWGLHKGVFIGLAVVVLLSAPFLLALPTAPLRKKEDTHIKNDSILSLSAMLLFIAEIFVMTGMGAAWAFGERLGLAINLTPKEIGFYFALTMAASIAGSLFVGWMGLRFGRALPFVVTTALVCLCCYLMANPGLPVVFIISILVFQAFQAIFIPLLIGVGAALESTGRLSAAVVAVEIFSFGAGGFIGGYVAENSGLPAIGWLAVAGAVVSIPLFLAVCLPLERDAGTVAMDKSS